MEPNFRAFEPKIDEKKRKIRKFRILSYISSIVQIGIIIFIFLNFLNLEWEKEIDDNIKLIYPEDQTKKDDAGKRITIFCIKYGLKCSFILISCLIIWRNIYNYKYVKFFDGNVAWFNNYYFYLFYSTATPIFCTIAKNNSYSFYEYFVYGEIFSAYIMAFSVVLSLLVIVWFFFTSVIGETRETGRHWEGNTQVISYEYVDNGGGSCGCYFVEKIFGKGYFILTFYGYLILILLMIGMDHILFKFMVILEFLINCYVFWLIIDFKRFLKKFNVSI